MKHASERRRLGEVSVFESGFAPHNPAFQVTTHKLRLGVRSAAWPLASV
jgi:hypothetical protein